MDISTQFQHWLTSQGKSEKTAQNYAGAVFGPISKWGREAGLLDKGLSSIDTPGELRVLLPNLQALDIFTQRDLNGNGMYSAALKLYESFLDEISGDSLTDDIARILEDNDISETEKSAYVNARVGQGRYRKELCDYWRGCAVTGYSRLDLLVASHIKPWKYSDGRERLNPFNGLLLVPNLDKVFDRGYITFESDGKIRVSSCLEEPEVLGVNGDLQLQITPEHAPFLEFHRNVVFESHLA